MSSNSPDRSGAGDHPGTDGPGEAVDPAPRPVRRSFRAAYRAKVAVKYEAAPHGSTAAMLRREGVYQSQIREWTTARDATGPGRLGTSTDHRWLRAAEDDPARLRAENQRLTRELAESAAVVEIMGKLQGLL